MPPNSKAIDDIIDLVESIPIVESVIQTAGSPIDTEFGIDYDVAEKLGLSDSSISLRQIINRLNDFLIKNPAFDMVDYLNEHNATAGYPINYLVFDYCLSALGGDLLDSKLYLAHSFYIMGFKKQVNLLLSAILYNKLINDKDVRRFLTLLASSVEPMSASSHSERFGNEYKERYESYRDGLSQILNQKKQ